MNELVEMLELKKNLDKMINEAIGELTVSEFVQLQEAGVLTEGITSGLLKVVKNVLKKGVESGPGEITKLRGVDSAIELRNKIKNASKLISGKKVNGTTIKLKSSDELIKQLMPNGYKAKFPNKDGIPTLSDHIKNVMNKK